MKDDQPTVCGPLRRRSSRRRPTSCIDVAAVSNHEFDWGVDAVELAVEGSSVLAVPEEGDASDHVVRVLGRRVRWQRTGIGLREALREALR